MSKTLDSYFSVGLLAAHNFTDWFGSTGMNLMILPHLFRQYNKQYKLEDEKEKLQELEDELNALQGETTRIGKTPTCTVLTEKEKELQYNIALKKEEIAALKSKSVHITYSTAYNALKICVFESILDYSMESSNSYMRVVATPFAFAFFCIFMEKMVFDRYQYKEDAEHGLEDCAPGKNKALIFYFTLLQATTIASCNLASFFLIKRYGANISSCIKTVIPLPGVIDNVANTMPMPRLCGSLFNEFARAALTKSIYTHEVDVDQIQMER